MLKTRVIPVLLLKNGLIIRSELHKYHQVIGDPLTQLRRYDHWQVDELVYLDISRDSSYDVRRNDAKIGTAGASNILDIIKEVAKVCFIPLSVGGGIRTLDDIRRRLSLGADKVVLNTAAHQEPSFITDAAKRFGSQCIVVSIDAYRASTGEYDTYAGGQSSTGRDPVAWAKEVVARGAGEILLNSVDRDGTAQGYDLPLIQAVADAVPVPVIALGGVGDWAHMVHCIQQTKAAAVAAANKFHFTEMSYQQAKKYLSTHNCSVRKPAL